MNFTKAEEFDEEIARPSDGLYAVTATLGIVILVTNLSVVISSGLVIKKYMKPLGTRCTYLLLGNVALSDMITGGCVFAGAVYPKAAEYRSHIGCSFFLSVATSSMFASTYSVILIALDRYLYIMRGLRYNQQFFVRKVKWIIWMIWILAIVLSFTPINCTRDSFEGRKCWFISVEPPGFIIFSMVAVLIPIIFICVMYGHIFYKAIRQEENSRRSQIIPTVSNVIELRILGSNSEATQECLTQFKRGNVILNLCKTKAFRIVFFTTSCFTLTWTYWIAVCSMYLITGPKNDEDKRNLFELQVTKAIMPLMYINNLMNPVIYAWWHKKFRQDAARMWRTVTNGKRIIRKMFVGANAAT